MPILTMHRTSVVVWVILIFGFSTAVAEENPGETFKLSGTVYDKDTHDGLPGVSVFFPALKKGTITDAHGHYVISGLKAGTYEVTAQIIGYGIYKKTIELNRSITLDITLTPDPLQIEGSTVTVERDNVMDSYQSVTALDEGQLDQHRGQTLGETLKDVPGVSLLQTGPSIAKPVVRGLHSQRVVVLNDGVTQEGQQWGGEHAPEIDPFAAGSITVIRGAAGLEYGAGAIGGVIRVEPSPLPEHAGIGGELSLNGFTNNRQMAGALRIEGGLANKPGFGWRAQVSGRKAGNAQTPRYVIGNSGFQEFNGSAAVGFRNHRWESQLYYSHFGTELGIYKGSHIGNTSDLIAAIKRNRVPLTEDGFSFAIGNPRQVITHDLISARVHRQTDAGDRFEFQGGWQRNHRQEFDSHKPLGTPAEDLKKPSFDLSLYTYTADVRWRHRPIGDFAGTIGVNVMRQRNVNQAIRLIPSFRTYNAGLYWIEKWVQDDWSAEAGLRYDQRWLDASFTAQQQLKLGVNENEDHVYRSTSAAVGVNRRFAEYWSIGINAGTAWRPPGVNELYSNGVHHGTAQYEIGDPAMGVEKSYSTDITLHHNSEKINGDVSVFVNRMDNYIHLYPSRKPTLTIRGAFPTFRYAQTEAQLTGIDGQIQWHALDIVRLDAGWSIVRGRDLKKDEPLIYMPSDRFSGLMHWHFSDAGTIHEPYVDIGITWYRRQSHVPEGAETFVNDADSVTVTPPPGYVTVDFEVGCEWHTSWSPITISLAINNVFNTRYANYLSRFRYYIDDPGRNIVLRVQIPFGNLEF